MDAATMVLVLIGSGFIGFLFAPLGLGGGLLFAPLLHYGLGWEIDGALLIVSLGLSATVAWGSGLRHRKEGHVSDERFKQSLWGGTSRCHHRCAYRCFNERIIRPSVQRVEFNFHNMGDHQDSSLKDQ